MVIRKTLMEFYFPNKDMMRKKYNCIAEVIWYPHKKKHVMKLERVQRIATKMEPDSDFQTNE